MMDDDSRPGCRNMLTPAAAFRTLELIMVFTVFMFTRVGGGDGDMLAVGDVDDENADAFAYMVVFGYFYILIVQMIGILLGEEMNVQNLIYIGMAFIFFLALGATQIAKTKQMKNNGVDYKDGNRMAMGSLCIITSLIYLADTCYTIYTVKKERSSY